MKPFRDPRRVRSSQVRFSRFSRRLPRLMEMFAVENFRLTLTPTISFNDRGGDGSGQNIHAAPSVTLAATVKGWNRLSA